MSALKPLTHRPGFAPTHPETEARPFVLEAMPVYCNTGRPLRVQTRPGLAFAWDEFTEPTERGALLGEREATTARGWCALLSHPDRARLGSDPWNGAGAHYGCGSYLDYGPLAQHYAEQPEGAVHASAHYRDTAEFTEMIHHVSLGSRWCRTVAEAKAWIERTVTAHARKVAR